MKSIRMMLAGLAALVVLVPAAVWAASSGLPKGSDAPTIHIDAFNDNRGQFCVTCEAGRKPAMVAFVRKNDEATRNLIYALDQAYRNNQSKHLYAGVVILGGGDAAQGLKKYVLDQHYRIPAALLSADNSEVKRWKLNSSVDNTCVFMTQHKVKASLADLSSSQVAGQVKQITG